MDIIYAQEPFPQTVTKTLYLAGPSPRTTTALNWRQEALQILNEKNYDGVVYVPLDRNGGFPQDVTKQLSWEQTAMDRSDIILFWVPRDLEQLPGFTTNIEFGQRVKGRNIILGFPQHAPKMHVLEYLARENFVPVAHELPQALTLAFEKLGDGAVRAGGETHVPLHLWNLPHFQNWLQAQQGVGNRLDEVYSIELQFGVGSQQAFLLYWGMHVNLFVAAEQRHKSNEIVLSRPDIQNIVAYYQPEEKNFLDAEIILIREFRSTATTGDGFIYEVPGGSGFKPIDPETSAAKELQEETGIKIDPNRLVHLPSRQLAGTTTAHRAHVFSLKLTEAEITSIKQQQGQSFGNTNETEQTYPEVYKVQELLENPYTDWSNLGMIFMALYHSEGDNCV